jgi:hypothetical protein
MAQDEAMASKKLALGAGGDNRISFVRGESRTTRQAVTENPEEINIDDVEVEEDDDEEEGNEEMEG